MTIEEFIKKHRISIEKDAFMNISNAYVACSWLITFTGIDAGEYLSPFKEGAIYKMLERHIEGFEEQVSKMKEDLKNTEVKT